MSRPSCRERKLAGRKHHGAGAGPLNRFVRGQSALVSRKQEHKAVRELPFRSTADQVVCTSRLDLHCALTHENSGFNTLRRRTAIQDRSKSRLLGRTLHSLIRSLRTLREAVFTHPKVIFFCLHAPNKVFDLFIVLAMKSKSRSSAKASPVAFGDAAELECCVGRAG